MSGFEWDEAKEERNFQKHGIDFETASLIWDSPIIQKLDIRRDYGEDRFVAFGLVEGRVLAVVYTWRGEARRLISARKATRRERQAYEEEIIKRATPAPD